MTRRRDRCIESTKSTAGPRLSGRRKRRDKRPPTAVAEGRRVALAMNIDMPNKGTPRPAARTKMLFSRRNAMSGAPIMIGVNQVRFPINAGIDAEKIMIRPSALNTMLGTSRSPKILQTGLLKPRAHDDRQRRSSDATTAPKPRYSVPMSL